MPRKDGEQLLGQLYDRELDVVVGFTETAMQQPAANALVGQARTEISPMDGHSSLVRVYNLPILATTFVSFTGTTNLNLPDVLVGITVTYNTSSGGGQDIHQIGGVVVAGPSGSVSLTPSSRAQGSVAILPDISPTIRQTWGQNIPTTVMAFFMLGNFTSADLIQRIQELLTIPVSSVVGGAVNTGISAHNLSVGQKFKFVSLVAPSGGIATDTVYFVRTVVDSVNFTYSTTFGGLQASGHNATSGTQTRIVERLPVFKPESHTFTLKGEQVSISQNADSLLQYSWTPETISYAIAPAGGSLSEGSSTERGVTIRSVTLPPTIHGAINISTPTASGNTFVTVKANVPFLTGSGGAPSFNGVVNEPQPYLAVANASVTPTSLGATSGATSIPTAGLFIVDVAVRPYSFNYQRVIVTLVDFSYFA